MGNPRADLAGEMLSERGNRGTDTPDLLREKPERARLTGAEGRLAGLELRFLHCEGLSCGDLLSHLHLWIGKGESWEDWWWGVLAQAGRGAGLGLTGNLPPPQASSHPGTSRGPAPCWLCTSTPCLESGPCSTESHRAMSLTSS